MDAADSVAEIHAVVATRAFYGAIARGENYRLALISGHNFSLGLRAGLLLDQKKFAAVPIASLLAEKKNHLKGERDLAIQILVQAVVAAPAS